MSDLAEMLQDYGGWGVSAVTLIVVWRLLSYISKQHQLRMDDAKSHTATLETVTEKYVTATIHIRATLDGVTKTMDKMCDKIQ